MGSKKLAKPAMRNKGVHKDLYLESEDEADTKGLWERINALTKLGHFDSASAFVRRACVEYMKKFQENGTKATGKKAAKLKEAKEEFASPTPKVKVTKVGQTFRVMVNNLKEDEKVVVKAMRWARKDDGKAVKATGGYEIAPTATGLTAKKVNLK